MSARRSPDDRRRIAVVRLVLVNAVCLLPSLACFARDDGRFAQADPELRQWFRDQKSPATGISCCSEADGEFAEEDIRYDGNGVGHYWTRWSAHPQWIEVPDGVVIRAPNKWGRPTVWGRKDQLNGTYVIRCYAPGSGA